LSDHPTPDTKTQKQKTPRLPLTGAVKKKYEANKAEAEATTAAAQASEAQSRAKYEPARQIQALAAGWVRIVLTVLSFGLTVALVIIGLKTKQVWPYPSAVLTGACLYPLRPWEFFPLRNESEKDNPTSAG
jgi:hypothetical protein